MKKSMLLILIAAALIFLGMVTMMVLARIAVGSAQKNPGGPSTGEWRPDRPQMVDPLVFSGFDTVIVDGEWKLVIRQGQTFSGEIRYPAAFEDRVSVTQTGNRLILGVEDHAGRSSDEMVAEIVMPELVELVIEGAADAEFRGFDSDRLDIIIVGAARVVGKESRAKRLDVELSGVGQIDLAGVKAVDARVNLDGAGQIVLDMDGGVLEGTLGGMGQIRYSGSVSDERIVVEGMGKVRHDG